MGGALPFSCIARMDWSNCSRHSRRHRCWTSNLGTAIAKGSRCMTTTLDRVRNVAAREFNIDPASLTAATESADVSRWDSASHLMLMMALEEEFNISFELDEVVELMNVG